jgi:putative inorganic carbon (hco3(-)) transporter
MPFFFLASFLFMLYASPAFLFPALAVFHPAQVAGIGAMTVFILQKRNWTENWKFIRPEGGMMVFILVGAALSCLGAFWPKLAVENTMVLLKIGVIYFAIVNLVDTPRRMKITALALMLGGLFPALGTIYNYATGNFCNCFEGNRASWIGAYANPNDLAYALVILIPLAFQMSRISHWVWKPVFWGILAIFFAGIVATHSRGGLVGAGAVMLLIGLRQRGIPSRVITASILSAGLVYALFFWGRSEGFQDISKDFTAHQRIETIKAGLRMFIDYPLLGVGLGCSVVAWPFYAPPDIDFRTSLIIHNTVVQAMSEMGLLGFVPFVIFIGAGWVHVRRVMKSAAPDGDARKWAIALEASLFGFLVCGLFGGYVVSWFPYIIVGLISALMCLTKGKREFNEIDA